MTTHTQFPPRDYPRASDLINFDAEADLRRIRDERRRAATQEALAAVRQHNGDGKRFFNV